MIRIERGGRTVNRGGRNLMNDSQRISMLIFMAIIIAVQILSLLVVLIITVSDIERDAEQTANELKTILIEPLYNVDDAQTLRIGETLLSSGRFSVLVIESTASGIIVNESSEKPSFLVKPKSRVIEHKGINLGKVQFRFSDREVFRTIEVFFLFMMILDAAVLLAGFLADRFLVRKRIRLTFGVLENGISEIASGNYEYVIPETGYTDIDSIINLMNAMAGRIRSNNAQLIEMNNNLEVRVADRTAELEVSLTELHLLQERLVESGKLSALGQLAAGIAHELNTPLGAITSSARTLIEYLDLKLPSRIARPADLTPEEASLFDSILSLGIAGNRNLNIPPTNRKLLRDVSRVLEDAGIPNGSGVADCLIDIGLAGWIPVLLPLLDTPRNLEIVTAGAEPVNARRMAGIIGESADKAAGVVTALRSYLAPGQDENERPVDVNETISRVLTLMHNMLKYGIQVRTDFSRARVLGSSDKLSQVWMNLIRNAAQAMDFRGELLLRTETVGGSVRVSVIDSGPGVPEEIRDRIFEPFFTTKKHGEGMGLGLDICRRIVENHRGTIEFESGPAGTEFIVTIPAAPTAEDIQDA